MDTNTADAYWKKITLRESALIFIFAIVVFALSGFFGAREFTRQLIDKYETFEFDVLVTVFVTLVFALIIFSRRMVGELKNQINEHLKAEELLQKRVRIFEYIEWGLAVCGEEGRTLEIVNPAFAKMHGYTPQELAGKPVDYVFPPESHMELREQFLMAREKGHHAFPSKNIRKDGTIFPVIADVTAVKDEQGKVLFHIVWLQDITGRSSVDTALKDCDARYRTLVEIFPDAIALLDPNAGIIMANPQAAVLFGWSEKELVGMNVLDLIAPEERVRVKENMQRILKTGEVRTSGQTFLRKDCTSFPAELKIAFIKDGENKLKEAVAIISDVNERVRGETLRFENERLVLAAKVKNDFLAIMSHELRTPLNSMIGFSELLKQKIAGKLSDKQERYVDNIISSGKHLLELISDLLELSRIQAGKVALAMEKISVPATIDETLILIKERASKHNVLIKKEFDPALEFMEADKQKFKHILFSLLDNAVKFSKMEGGTVTITTKKERDMVKISVSDTGIGIKEEDAGKLFMVFQPIDSGEAKAYGSTGLGLAISKLFVELHGGRIWAESRYGEGSTFTFLLPIEAKKRDVK